MLKLLTLLDNRESREVTSYNEIFQAGFKYIYMHTKRHFSYNTMHKGNEESGHCWGILLIIVDGGETAPGTPQKEKKILSWKVLLSLCEVELKVKV